MKPARAKSSPKWNFTFATTRPSSTRRFGRESSDTGPSACNWVFDWPLHQLHNVPLQVVVARKADGASSPKNSNSMCAITMQYGARLASGFARSAQVSAKARAGGAMRSTKRSRAWVRSSGSPRSRPLPMAAALRLPSTRRVTAGWSQALFNQDERDAASPSADRLNWARCCARRRIMRAGYNERFAKTELEC